LFVEAVGAGLAVGRLVLRTKGGFATGATLVLRINGALVAGATLDLIVETAPVRVTLGKEGVTGMALVAR
jgi:hypothetical protein